MLAPKDGHGMKTIEQFAMSASTSREMTKNRGSGKGGKKCAMVTGVLFTFERETGEHGRARSDARRTGMVTPECGDLIRRLNCET